MPRTPLALLTGLLLTAPACHHEKSPSNPPEETRTVEPTVQEDPIEGDPADIENPEEIGEEQMDSAKLVSPGPAEAEVQTGHSLDEPQPK